MVEGTFTMNFLVDIFSNFDLNPDYTLDHVHLSEGGRFDPELECISASHTIGGSDKACCGSFADLSRQPYRLFSGVTTRSCCGGEVIDEQDSQCCQELVKGIDEAC